MRGRHGRGHQGCRPPADEVVGEIVDCVFGVLRHACAVLRRLEIDPRAPEQGSGRVRQRKSRVVVVVVVVGEVAQQRDDEVPARRVAREDDPR